MFRAVCLLMVLIAPSLALAGDKAAAEKSVLEERPTLHCLGVRWQIGGDDNRNARIDVQYRAAGAKVWKQALDLFRVESQGMRPETRPPEGKTLFAGSVFGLEPGTEYELRLSLVDPDGGNAVRTLQMTTRSEPRLPDGRKIDVRPGELTAALKAAKPGDHLILHAGTYAGPIEIPSGTPQKPIALLAAGDGPVVLDGRGKSNVIGCRGLHDVFFEGLTVRNATWGIAVNGGARIVVRRCTIEDIDYAITATANTAAQQDFFIGDNTLVGRSTWPRTQGIENRRGVQISGAGHAICYNRIRGFADGIDTYSTYPCSSIDIYRNEISECTDDGIEMDYSEHNTRCFENRLTNVFQGISVQPVHGGPVYVFRNAMFNVEVEPFKMHNSPSGALFFHNTVVKAGPPTVLMTSEPASNCVSRNNLFVGTEGQYAFENEAPMRDCDFDRDGFGGAWKLFLKWNGERYPTLEDAARRAPVYRRAVRVDPATAFRSVRPPKTAKTQLPIEANDLRLAERSAAIDAGVPMANVNDDFQGQAPDLGAYELGQELPHYGPRPERSK